MTTKSIVLLALLAAACSSGPDPVEQQKRIAELEQQNAQLQADLKKAKDNFAALERATTRSAPAGDDGGGGDGPSGPVAPEPVNPQPDNNVGGSSAGT